MIKLTAFILMLLAHVGFVFFPNSVVLLIVGRLAFPLFSWGIAQGYKYSKDLKQYTIRLLVIAILSQYPYYLVFHNNYLNVCFTLLAGVVVLALYNCSLNKWWKLIFISCVFIFVDIMNFEYGMYGVALILVFYIFGVNVKGIPIHLAITLIGIYFYQYNIVQVFSILSITIIYLFKNQNFRINRYVGYAFYPLHLIVIYMASIYSKL